MMIAAMKLALEAMEEWDNYLGSIDFSKEIAALRLAIDAHNMASTAKYSDIVSDGGLDPRNQFDAPPKREWVGLTDAERHDIREWQKIQEELGPVWAPMMLYLYLAIEAKLKEKNT